MKNKTLWLIIGYILFIGGLAIGLVFSGLYLWANIEGLAFWGYPESITFDNALSTDVDIGRLKCPLLLTDGELGVVRLPVTNISDKSTRAFLKAHISMPGELENMVRRARSTNLGPGEKSEVRWQVTTENTIFDHMILIRAFGMMTEFHPPSRTQHCGIISANLWGLSSTVIVLLAVGGSLILMVAGVYIVLRTRIPAEKGTNIWLVIFGLLGLLTAISLISSLFHIWEVVLLAAILIPVLIFSSIGYYLGKRDNRYN